ncbi:MAG TPA: alpha/beta hydrolase [Cyclobacteriaceae bacterium]|nr:alpha/beta hydrolase [Cyclobacteriaceae bacterium]
MTKSKPIKIPLAFRIIRWGFPKLEKISTRLSGWYFEKIFFTPFRYKTPDKELEAVTTAKLFSVIAAGKKIQCYQWGEDSKPYVLVVHGWAGRSTQFRKFIPQFNEAGYRIIGFDGPAHGKSEGKRTSIAEFEEVMKSIASVKGYPEAIIAHSFGGGASLFAIAKGFPVKKLINIASPTIADRIIQSYLKAIGGSWKTAENFKALIKHRHGKSFEEFTALSLIRQVPSDLNLMLVHDEEDKEVEIIHVHELIKVFPSARLLATKGLGHNRILKDEKVISACVDFVTGKISM